MAGLNECAEVRTCVFLPDEEGGRMSQIRRKNRGSEARLYDGRKICGADKAAWFMKRRKVFAIL